MGPHLIHRDPVFDLLIGRRPDLWFLMIGGNDIWADTEPKELAEQIEQLAKAIEDLSGSHCEIISLESRTWSQGSGITQSSIRE